MVYTDELEPKNVEKVMTHQPDLLEVVHRLKQVVRVKGRGAKLGDKESDSRGVPPGVEKDVSPTPEPTNNSRAGNRPMIAVKRSGAHPFFAVPLVVGAAPAGHLLEEAIR